MQESIHVSDLALDVNVLGTPSTIHPVLLWDQDGATLVDAGYPGIFPQFRQAVEQRIQSLKHLKRIILTHQDWDHTGTIPDFLHALEGQVQIFAHTREKPYLEGTVPHYKLTPAQIAARIQSLPESLREKANAMLNNLPKFQVTHALEDGEVLPFHGGIEVIHVPGHTPGNMCLYVKSRRLLIAGDQLRVDGGMLVGPAPEYTPDMETAQQSLKKLLNYDIHSVICYHGGAYSSNAAVKIAEIAG